MSRLIKRVQINGEHVDFHEAGWIDGKRAAFVRFTGEDGFGVSMNMKLEEVRAFSASQDKILAFIDIAKSKLGITSPMELTKSECRVLQVVDKHSTCGQLAEKLFITESTLKGHLSKIYRKLNVKNRAGLIRYIEKNKHIVEAN
ncbi:helix-turn-helix transcriptional regulator [Vibrio aestuarianus]|uniref:helix-turn-helix domain-containing protein n=1 Tax=Vibrio aestuarianus TaxID=28171 RepID=UPI00237D3272|nr:helix-turn-helix transcriptional regulator [Vibrio aestuarianus]MDE1316326.1 helix-turn-helix transcriptional regulator [Vibrio aestuarianus]